MFKLVLGGVGTRGDALPYLQHCCPLLAALLRQWHRLDGISLPVPRAHSAVHSVRQVWEGTPLVWRHCNAQKGTEKQGCWTCAALQQVTGAERSVSLRNRPDPLDLIPEIVWSSTSSPLHPYPASPPKATPSYLHWSGGATPLEELTDPNQRSCPAVCKALVCIAETEWIMLPHAFLVNYLSAYPATEQRSELHSRS